MKVFISWSGTLSLEVAEDLRDWLPQVIQSVKPYVSSEDTKKGSRWGSEVAHELEASNFGILCLTHESLTAPWLNFEAGALSKFVARGHVSPLLIGLDRSDVTWPLAQFQSTLFQYSDVFRLMKSINSATGAPLEALSLEKAFKVWWPQLHEQVNKSIQAHAKTAVSAIAIRSSEDMLHELLDLTREQKKVLANLIGPSPKDPLKDARPKIIRGVDFDEIDYFLKRIRSAVDEAIEIGKPETPKLVELRALIMLLSKMLPSRENK
jgi:TIR domain